MAEIDVAIKKLFNERRNNNGWRQNDNHSRNDKGRLIF
jgi:hypothetical protein